MKNARQTVIYVGKASSLKKRVNSYLVGAHDTKTTRLVQEIAKISFQLTDSVLEATILEAELIKKYKPQYNILQKDDRSFLYIVITKEKFPKVLIKRGSDLKPTPPNLRVSGNKQKYEFVIPSEVEARLPAGQGSLICAKRDSSTPLRYARNDNSRTVYEKKMFRAQFGPFLNRDIVTSILKMMRRIFPYCNQGQTASMQSCFYHHLGQCPGVCTGEISAIEYGKIIRNLILFFRGKKKLVMKKLIAEMRRLSDEQKFEQAMILRNQIYYLEHIQDVHLLKRPSDLSSVWQRIEGYDISNISGLFATGSLVVFEQGEPNKSQYRRFKIKTVPSANDPAMIQEILQRRLKHSDWPMPDLILIDGVRGQVNAAVEICPKIPIVGIAKGPTRKKVELIFGPMTLRNRARIKQNQLLLIRVRDEAHRFAVNYHRKLRGRIGLV